MLHCSGISEIHHQESNSGSAGVDEKWREPRVGPIGEVGDGQSAGEGKDALANIFAYMDEAEDEGGCNNGSETSAR